MLNEFKNDELTIEQRDKIFDLLSNYPYFNLSELKSQIILKKFLKLEHIPNNWKLGDKAWNLSFTARGGVLIDTNYIDIIQLSNLIEEIKNEG